MWMPSWSLGLWAISTGLFALSYSAVGRGFPFKGTVSREYRAVNVVKGTVLAVCCPAGAAAAVAALVGPPWAGSFFWHTWLPAMAAAYAATDLSAMIYNPQAGWTTQLHHTLVQLFYLYLESIGYAPIPAVRAIILYAGISSCEFLVNLRLAARGMLHGKATEWLNRAALWVYLGGTYINLCGQAWLFWTVPGTMTLAYLGVLIAMGGVFVDDVKLIRYLWRWELRPVKR
jgi:hypothetical protein